MEEEEKYEGLCRLSADDGFRFNCTACGKCCMHREDLIFSPFDIYRAAKFLNTDVMSLIRDYLMWHEGRESRLPVFMPKLRGKMQKCVFLQNRRCRIHKEKPAVCELYPLGRLWNEDGTFSYFLQDVDCGTKNKCHTVREWLSGTGLETSETASLEWRLLREPLSEKMKGLFPGKKETELSKTVMCALMTYMYVNYDTSEEFLPQFRANMKTAEKILDDTAEVVKKASADESHRFCLRLLNDMMALRRF